MRTDTPQTIYLKDYTPYPYALEHVDLNFDIRAGETIVTASMQFRAKDKTAKGAPLFLNGENLELQTVKYNGKQINEYEITENSLSLEPADTEFMLELQTRLVPEENTFLEGLYKSGDSYCTQCEAEGFRRITFFPDRPDVLATYTTRIEASTDFPVLLGNGNLQEKGAAENGRHFAIWHDPFPKPCYLFALVAGALNRVHDTFTTMSGRKVDLYIYVRPGDEGQCGHAMESLKKSMKWEEEVYGLEYDLDIFNIVAVSDFNMGAMENKSLNIFNTALVLAQKDTATDHDFIRVESVIAHEYFHNWSGNRVTCRDWFQLSLKEGLTVFRDQEFSSDLNSRPVQRIDDVQDLRARQFPEDGGPLAHPIRPDNYIEINNFYTSTVYEKGAEVIRMFHTILGPEKYRKATDLYFSRYDGQAATCDDWIACMEEVSGEDLTQFRLWYEQAGTPEITFEGVYNEAQKTYSVYLSQIIPDTPGQKNKKPMHIPVRVGLLDENGHDIAEQVLHLKETEQSFTFENIGEKPIPSVLRGFSAPVKLKTNQSDEDLAFLMVHDSDGFNRWEAGQTLALRALESGNHDLYVQSYGRLLEDPSDPALLARAMTLPSVSAIGQHRKEIDPPAIYEERKALLATLKREHHSVLDRIYAEYSADDEFSVSAGAMGRRALKNAALSVLTSTQGTGCRKRAKDQYDIADNMTDRMAALSVLASIDCGETTEALEDFYTRFKNYPLVLDKWFALQASAIRTDIIQILNNLKQHTDFNIKNPNRVRSLYAAFAINNPVCFHAVDGSGYNFLCDAIIELNTINPQIAARLLGPLREWRRYTPDRQEKMKAGLERILATPSLSPNVFEIASKSLK